MIPSNISVLSIFDYSGDIKHSFISAGCSALSLDMYQNPENKTVDFVTDILNFDYKQFARSQFNFLYIALPCDVYSIASGGFHFSKGIPVTSKAISSINILIRLYQIVSYFDCRFIIENPAGGLINNNFFRQFFSLQVTRVCLASFGFPTQKKN
ncbi:MAG: hypothetical protein GY756_10205, partial [bacterium]|nr:hypothetical protein [bacterium]